jgi:Inner membrane component of T3SS, cytoplasmic domain
MADLKRPSLTVLGGPMAGTRFVIDESFETVVLGADETCDFRLALPGVAPIHARLVVEGSAVSIHDAGSDGGLHVNDNPVLDSGTPLRNGDIVWLGTPGEPDVVMLQCILPRPSAAAAAPAPAPESVPAEDETVALAPETLFSADPAPAVEPAPETIDVAPDAPAEPPMEILDIAREAMGGEPPREELGATEPISFSPPEPEEAVVLEAPPTTILSTSEFEDETAEPPPTMSFATDEPASEVVVDAGDLGAPSFGGPVEEPTVFYSGSEPEPTVAIPPEPEPPAYEPPPPPPPPVAPPPEPPRSTVQPKAQPRPARPAPRAEASRPAKPAAAPRPAPKPAAARASSGAPVGRYAAMGLAALLVIGAGAFGAMRFLRAKPAPTATTPAPVVQNTPIPPPISQAVAPEPEPSLAPEPEPTDLATPSPLAATPIPRPTTTPLGGPSPSPSPRKGAPTPAPTAAAVAAPSAESLRAAQVATLMGQAEASLGARQYDAAIGHFDDVLRLDPGNAKATADRASAVALRDAARRKFVPGRTVVKTEKATGSLSGFDAGDVALQKAPDFLGRIDFEMSPASGIKPGDDYSLKIILVNEGKKAIRIQGLSVNTVVNGSGASAPAAARVREVQPQQRAELGEVTGSWRDGTTSWSTEVLVTANKGDSLKNTIAWR